MAGNAKLRHLKTQCNRTLAILSLRVDYMSRNIRKRTVIAKDATFFMRTRNDQILRMRSGFSNFPIMEITPENQVPIQIPIY